MADTYTLQYPGERVDQDLERAERATVDLPLAATLGAEAQGFPLVVTTALSEVNEMYKLYAANRSRYRWMLVVTQASGGAFVEVAEVEPVTQSGGIDLVFDSKYNGRRYAVTLKLAGGEVTTVSAHVLADLSNPVLQGKSAGGGDTPIREVTDRSGKTFYPVTAAAGVKMPDGTTLDESAKRSTTALDVLAHSDCTLEERVAQLESLLVRMLSGDVLIPELQVKKLGVWGGNNIVVTGAGAPSKAPDRAGQFYIDTKNNAVYHSVGNNAVSDWKNN